jgi:hypothetical protein
VKVGKHEAAPREHFMHEPSEQRAPFAIKRRRGRGKAHLALAFDQVDADRILRGLWWLDFGCRSRCASIDRIRSELEFHDRAWRANSHHVWRRPRENRVLLWTSLAARRSGTPRPIGLLYVAQARLRVEHSFTLGNRIPVDRRQ